MKRETTAHMKRERENANLIMVIRMCNENLRMQIRTWNEEYNDPILWNCVGSRSYEFKKNLDETTEAELICYPPLNTMDT